MMMSTIVLFLAGLSVVVATTSPKLIYFDARGAAELSRVLFKVGDLEFEDFRYPIVTKEGGGFETSEFSAAKSKNEFAANMDRVPLLEINGQKIGQSKAIERYIANKCGLMGADDVDRAIVDCITENVRDIKDKWGKIRMMGGFGNSPEKEAAMSKWFNGGELSEWLVKLEKSLPNSSSEGFAVGSKTSYADVSIWHLLRDTFPDATVVSEAEKKAKCQKLTKIATRLSDLPAIKNWIKSRPKTVF
mmetsp:Transcript_21343/g.29361  ORF Transcript_21343/g.29361 Transcript_21343/m.29361 type:complete len:246 (-) Transcript_21343:46-783(-)